MSTTVWLKWDGIYSSSGMCNHLLTPLNNGGNQMEAIKERLTLLGFDCKTEEQTKESLLTFNGYCNHPNINRLSDIPEDDADQAQQDDEGGGVRGDDDTTTEDDATQDDADNIRRPNWNAYYDAQTITMLQELDDPMVRERIEPEDEAGPSNRVIISRSHMEREQIDLTLNSVTALGVKVVSTPKSFTRFAESAAIKLQIKGFNDVKSLLFRVYRNYDPNTDKIYASEDRIIYQEVLKEDEIKTLPTEGPKKNIIPQHPAKAYIMKQMIGGGMDGSFGNYIDKVYDRLHAPYKIRVWVSIEEGFFDEYVMTSNPVFGANLDSLNPIFYLDQERVEDARDRRRDSLSSEDWGGLLIDSSEPDVDFKKSVHDKSNLEEKSQRGILTNWNSLKRQNAALKKSKYWTKNDSQGTNLIEIQCEKHTIDFLQENEIQKELFPIEFSQNPLGVYRDLRSRLDAVGDNFPYPELREVFDNVKRHINIVERRLCCGQWSHIDAEIRENTINFTKERVLPELSETVSRGYKYDPALVFLNKYMFLFSFIVHKGVVRPELDFYSTFGIGEKKAPSQERSYVQYIIQRRNRIDGCRSPSGSEYGFTANHPFDGSDNPEDFYTTGEGRPYVADGYPSMKKGTSRVMRNKQVDVLKPILIPSFNPLDAYFFVKIRAVPLYMIGMLDMQYLIADGIRQMPVGFFEHDLFHVHTFNTPQQWEVTFNRLLEIIEKTAQTDAPLNEFEIYERWFANINKIAGDLGNFPGNQDALKFLLFFLLHEPASSAKLNRKLTEREDEREAADEEYTKLDHSACSKRAREMSRNIVPEPSEILKRLESNFIVEMMLEKTEQDFFGGYERPWAPHFAAAADWLRQYTTAWKQEGGGDLVPEPPAPVVADDDDDFDSAIDEESTDYQDAIDQDPSDDPTDVGEDDDSSSSVGS